MLLLPRQGAPVFATALSKRVANWIRSTDSLSQIVNTPKPGAAVGLRIADAGCKRVGVLDYDSLPAGLDGEIADAAPAVAMVEISGIFAPVRCVIDDAERGLIERADALAKLALDQIGDGPAVDAGAVAGLVEKQARLGGAEEAYIAVAPDLDADRRMVRVAGTKPLAGRFAVRASVAYKGAWVRRTRSFAGDASARNAYAAADAWLATATASMAPGESLARQIDRHSRELPGATVRQWIAESCVGSDPLTTVATPAQPSWAAVNGSFLVLTVEMALDGVPWLGSAPVFLGRA
jgi:hypothetical protein